MQSINWKGAAIVAASAVAVVLAAAVFFALQADADSGLDRYEEPSLKEASESREFALYDAGPSVGPHELRLITRQVNPRVEGEPNGVNAYNFVYGECEAESDSGCIPPLQIQIWPACERTYASIDKEVGRTRSTLRGVPAATFADAYRLEIYTGRVTVVIDGPKELRDIAAEQLRATNELAGDVAAGEPLPAPASGAVEGDLACTDAERGGVPEGFFATGAAAALDGSPLVQTPNGDVRAGRSQAIDVSTPRRDRPPGLECLRPTGG